MLSLLVIALFVVSCAPKESADGEEGALAGQAIGGSGVASSFLIKNDYFGLEDAAGKIHIFQYIKADPVTNTGDKLYLEDAEGEDVILDYINDNSVGTFKGGFILTVWVAQKTAGDEVEGKDYFLIFRNPNPTKANTPLKVCLDENCNQQVYFSKPAKIGWVK